MGSPGLPRTSFNEQSKSDKSNPINMSMVGRLPSDGKFIPFKWDHLFFSCDQLMARMFRVMRFVVWASTVFLT